MKDTTTTIDEMIEQFAVAQKRLKPTITTTQFKQALLKWHKDKARSYVPERLKPSESIGALYASGHSWAIDQTLKAIETLANKGGES